LTLLAGSGVAAAMPQNAGTAGATTTADPDALYAQRDDLAKARQAADIWQGRVKANPKDYEASWKLARAMYWLGGHGPQDQRRADLENGTKVGQAASLLEPNKPEGYFWMAANMGALAESYGLGQGLKYRGKIKDALETVLKIDPAFMDGSADRALGRWYYLVPGFFGGDKKKSEEHLRKSLTYDPNSTASHFFLAETLMDDGKKPEARAELQKVLDAPLNPTWAPEDREFKNKAKNLLDTLK
jgi:tetratricopeptide (TPR) repeat protein